MKHIKADKIKFETIKASKKIKKERKRIEKIIKNHFKTNGTENIPEIIEPVRKWLGFMLNENRYTHALSAEITARKIARLISVNEDKAGLAALLHDCAKSLSHNKLINICNKYNVRLIDKELYNYSCLHAPAGACIVRKKLGIKDKKILNAIRYHIIGRDKMSKIEKIVFIADEIEPFLRSQKLNEKTFALINTNTSLDKAFNLVA